MANGETLKEMLPQDLQSDAAIQKFSGDDLSTQVTGLFKSYKEAESKLGNVGKEHETKLSELQTKLDNAIQVPGKDADDNTRRDFYTKLGCPSKPEEYPDVEIKGLPEGFERDDETVKLIKDACYKAGINKEHYKAVMEQITKQQLVSLDTFVKQDEQAEQEATKSLTQDWGGEAKYKEKTELARRLIKHYDPEDKAISEFLMDTRLGSYAPLVKLLGNIASDIIGEETTFTGETAAGKKEGEVERSPTTGEVVLVYDKSPELK